MYFITLGDFTLDLLPERYTLLHDSSNVRKNLNISKYDSKELPSPSPCSPDLQGCRWGSSLTLCPSSWWTLDPSVYQSLLIWLGFEHLAEAAFLYGLQIVRNIFLTARRVRIPQNWNLISKQEVRSNTKRWKYGEKNIKSKEVRLKI